MPAKATTIRLKEDVQSALAVLSEHTHRTMNTLVNEAVESYLGQNMARAESDLEATLAKLRAYRKRDPHFEKAIDSFAEAEAKYPDPTEGRIVKKKTSTASTKVRHAAHA
jgi:predicted DNA-binding protein